MFGYGTPYDGFLWEFLLADVGRTLDELSTSTGFARRNVTTKLKALHGAGLARCEQSLWYRVDDDLLLDELAATLGLNERAQRRAQRYADERAQNQLFLESPKDTTS